MDLLKKSKIIIVSLLAGIMLLSVPLAGCGNESAQATGTDSSAGTSQQNSQYYTPEKFKIAVGLAIDMATAETKYAKVKAYFARELGMPVELFVPSDYTAMIQAMKYKHIDLGYQGPFSYVISRQEFDCVPLAAMGKAGVPDGYRSYITVGANTDIMTMDDLVAKASEIEFAFVDPDSTSGNLIPRAMLTQAGITDPEQQFKNVVFAGGHDAVILSIVAGKTDAGGIGRHPPTWDLPVSMVESGAIPPDSLRYLMESDIIPPTPFQIRSDLDPALAAKVKDAILHMKERDMEAFKEYYASASMDDPMNFVEVDASDYDYLSQIASNLGLLK